MWQSGFSSRETSPVTTRPAVGQALFARALAIRHVTNLSEPIVLVSVDVIGLSEVVSSRVHDMAQQKYGLSRARLRLCASHTHSGGVVLGNLMALAPVEGVEIGKIERYGDVVVKGVLDVIGMVMVRKGRVSYARVGGTQVKVGVNRRQVTEDEFRTGGYRGNTQDEMPVLWFVGKGGGVVAGVFGFAGHASVVTGGGRYSGDFVGLATRMMERDVGGLWLFVAGCGGDVNVYPRGSEMWARIHARVLADGAEKVVREGGSLIVGGIQVVKHEFVRLKFARRVGRRELRRRMRVKNVVEKRAARALLQTLGNKRETDMVYERYPVAVWRIGGVTIAFMGGEPVVGYCNLLRELGVHWVVGYCEVVVGYVGTEQVVRTGGREGGERAAWYYGLPAAWHFSVQRVILHAFQRLLVP